MNRRTLAGLLVLNGVLLAAFLGLILPSGAQAQFGGAAGNYVMVAAEESGTDTVYLMDLNRGIILGIQPERRGRDNRLKTVSYRVIANDVTQQRRDR